MGISKPEPYFSVGKRVVFGILTAMLIVLLFASMEYVARLLQAERYGGAGAPLALRDRFVAWRNNPAYRRVDVHINAEGFRHNTDVPVAKPPNTVRVFLLGGSAAYGAQGGFADIDNRWNRIYNDQLIDAYLERRLNAELGSRRWEVINAAASGYRIHQQLALIQSVILRYHPDCVILMDGYNDFISLYNSARRGPAAQFDSYLNTPGGEEFDALANPGSLRSLLVFAQTWLTTDSALVRLLEGHVFGRVASPWGQPSGHRPVRDPVDFSDLTAAERAAATAALSHAAYYAHTARQINRILALDGIVGIFLLQPILILSHKPLTRSEQQMVRYETEQGGPLYFYLFHEVYARFASDMRQAARDDGFLFADQEELFDRVDGQAFTDFAHLTPQANQMIADQLFELLRERFATTPAASSAGTAN